MILDYALTIGTVLAFAGLLLALNLNAAGAIARSVSFWCMIVLLVIAMFLLFEMVHHMDVLYDQEKG